MHGIYPRIISRRLVVIPMFKPIKQKRRTFNHEKREAIKEEVDKLMRARFIKEVFYSDWVANLVMVKKANEKWRMWVDFIDLSKACPKIVSRSDE